MCEALTLQPNKVSQGLPVQKGIHKTKLKSVSQLFVHLGLGKMTNNFPICPPSCLDGKVIVRTFFFVSTIQTFIYIWLPVSLVLMKLTYGCQKLIKFLHFFTKQLLCRRNMQALKEVFCRQNSNAEFDCEIPLFLINHFV